MTPKKKTIRGEIAKAGTQSVGSIVIFRVATDEGEESETYDKTHRARRWIVRMRWLESSTGTAKAWMRLGSPTDRKLISGKRHRKSKNDFPVPKEKDVE